MSKKKSSLWIHQKFFKTTERHSLALCGSLCGAKQFLLIYISFNWFGQKYLFKHIQIFHRIWHFSNMVRKTNFLSIYVLISAIVTIMSKNKSSQWLPKKYFKTTERHSLAVCGSLWGEKQFLLILIPFYCFNQKNCLNKTKFFSGFATFKNVGQQTFWVFQCWFLRWFLLYLKRKVLYEFSQKCFKTT